MSQTRWESIDKPPPLREGDVHVWQAHLDWTEAEIQQGCQLLSDSEKERASRLIQPKHKQRYINSHAILRAILSLYVGVPPQVLQFRRGAQGKPYLISADPWQFNMSDSESMALYAVTSGQEVGIDLEFMRSNVDFQGIVDRFFSSEERKAFRLLPTADRQEAFYRGWTRKEAYIKAIGKGLSFGLDRFSVDLLPSKAGNHLQAVDGDPDKAKKWVVQSIPIEKNYAAALAVEDKILNIQYLKWNSPEFC